MGVLGVVGSAALAARARARKRWSWVPGGWSSVSSVSCSMRWVAGFPSVGVFGGGGFFLFLFCFCLVFGFCFVGLGAVLLLFCLGGVV